MVVFERCKTECGMIRYHYYPENHRNKKPGIIGINTTFETINVVIPAEEDFIRRISPSELNSMRDAINALRMENGEQELTEEEYPSATESEEWYWYADHAIEKIAEAYTEGEILERGTVTWY